MSILFEAGNNLTTTENGAVSYKSSLSKVVDLFFKAGASRGTDLTADFQAAYGENRELTLRLAQWLRDAREGAGERKHYTNFVKWVVLTESADVVIKLLHKTPELGRWDDLMAFWGTAFQNEAARFWVSAIEQGNGLAAKWAPRKDSKGAGPLRYQLKLTERNWRKMVVAASNTVEQLMCANRWEDINFEHIPSVAAARYQKAFSRHVPGLYQSYAKAVESGEAKINAGAIFPYDVLKSAFNGNDTVASAQWDALPNYLEGTEESFLPIIDTSGSMQVTVPGSNVTALEIAVGLGIYFAERNKSVFQNEFLTFAGTAKPHTITGKSLKEKYQSVVKHQDWDMSTNLQAAIEWILKTAIRNKLDASELPTKLLIVSDMQFNACANNTNLEAIQLKYEAAGYKMPGVIFWQVMARAGSMPVTVRDKNTAVVSGYSPAVVKSMLTSELDRIKAMLKVLNNDRYNI